MGSSETGAKQQPFQMVKSDPYLEPFQDSIQSRYDMTQKWIRNIEQNEGSLDNFSKGYEKYGFKIHSVNLPLPLDFVG